MAKVSSTSSRRTSESFEILTGGRQRQAPPACWPNQNTSKSEVVVGLPCSARLVPPRPLDLEGLVWGQAAASASSRQTENSKQNLTKSDVVLCSARTLEAAGPWRAASSGGRQQRAPRVDRLKFKTKFHRVLGLPCWSRVFLPDLAGSLWGSQRPAPSACWPSQYVQVRGGLDLREKGLSWPLGGWGSPFLFALGCLDGLGPEMATYLFKALEVEVAFVTHLEVRENTHMHSSQKGGPGKTSVEKASVVRSAPNSRSTTRNLLSKCAI